MNIRILKGYVSQNRRLYGVGEEVTIDDAIAMALVAQGKAVETQPFSMPQNQAEVTADANEVINENAGTSETVDESADMSLPDVDAAAAVKKAPTRRKGKK